PVSMNFWGFHPSLFGHLERLFKEFLTARGRELKSEFYIPFAVDDLIKAGQAKVKLLRTEAEWFGITYQADRPAVVKAFQDLLQAGVYPKQLW
ncbi:MAG: nucleotidyltransferase, partial [Bacteroidales bacterium]|nr:nucleotidyltransferase [Bacteroidales bacterium]